MKTMVESKSAGQLQSRVAGTVIAPGDAQYDEARMAWNLTVDQHPALIVVPDAASDVVEAVRFAGREGMEIAVQSTGHGVARPADGALLIVTSHMRDVRVDADAGTAWVGAGAKWGMVLEKTQPFGLAPLLGSSPDVGAIGYTLGGGMGWLARKYGLAADSVRSFELVTAAGEVLRASDDENADLFWALRGGGGSFGVVTGMEIQLYPVSTVYGGNLFYPVEQARDVFTRYREWIATVPDELTSSVVIMNFPPIPDVPEFLRGQSFAMVRGCYCGPVEDGAALLQEWREWQTPVIDDFKEMSFADVATISNDPEDPVPGYSTGAWLSALSDEVIDVLVRYGVAGGDHFPLVFTEVRHAGGAIAGVDSTANACGNRDASLILQLLSMTPTPEAKKYAEQHAAQYKSALQPYLTGGVYMNFLEGMESRERTSDAYSPDTYRRLTSLKAKYDPDNRFNFSFNIPPHRLPGDGGR